MILNMDEVFSSEDLIDLASKTLESEALVKDGAEVAPEA